MNRINLMLMIIAIAICCFELSQVGASNVVDNRRSASMRSMKRQVLTDAPALANLKAIGDKILSDSQSPPSATKPNKPVGKTPVTNKTEIPSLVLLQLHLPITAGGLINPVYTGVALSDTFVLSFIPITNLLAFGSDMFLDVYESSNNFDNDANFGIDSANNNFFTFDPSKKFTFIEIDFPNSVSIKYAGKDTGLYLFKLQAPLSSSTKPIAPEQLGNSGINIIPSTCTTYGFGPRATFSTDPTALNKVSTPVLCKPGEREACIKAVNGISSEIKAANPRLANFKLQPYSFCCGKLGDGKGDYIGSLERGDLGGLLMCEIADANGKTTGKKALIGMFAGDAAQTLNLSTRNSVPGICVDLSNPTFLKDQILPKLKP